MIWNFFRKLKRKSGRLDEFSFFLLTTALLLAIFLSLFRQHWFLPLTWFLVFYAYWRLMSSNQAKRAGENQAFMKYFYPIRSQFVNWWRGITRKKIYLYFPCKECAQPLRLPKKTGHVNVTCPKCKHSFTKKTIRGHIKSLS